MKQRNWKDISELLGMAAIIFSLVFVGMELRQSQQIAIAGQYQQRAESFVEQLYARLPFLSEQERLVKMVNSTYSDVIDASVLESMSDEMIALEFTRASADGTMFDNNYFQYQSGMMSDDGWQAMRGRLKRALRLGPFLRAELIHRGDRYRDSFRELCDQLMAENAREKEYLLDPAEAAYGRSETVGVSSAERQISVRADVQERDFEKTNTERLDCA